MKIRAIRGATTVKENSAKEIKNNTIKLFGEILNKNNIEEDNIVSIIITMTNDLDKIYPSKAIREVYSMEDTPFLNFEEKYVEGSMKKCIRILMYVYTDISKKDITHIYLNEAKTLRPDLCPSEEKIK
ncbi:chorismate mutase [Acetoanaerobium pronyense]|uniref:chorismate mutase n=1 Tax=Acetoanaerobium pronyense TaxID=1482736 RepID=A0ABS4KK80_9FIRM|nr:chorismate mutase [Acetoanaerobium pronyense]MBP2028195.1 chorismate mutase [Acetoanaerobium pronyense]